MSKKTNQNKKTSLWLFSCFGIFVLVISLLFNFGLLAYILSYNFYPGSIGTKQSSLPEVITEGDPSSSNKIAVIEINGPIFSNVDPMFSSDFVSSENIITQIKQASADNNVKAIFLKINSPGGTETAAEDIYHALMEAKDNDKPIYSHFSEVAASGGYYIALPSDKIISNPSTINGSIGVILESYNLEGLYDKIGIKPVTFKKGEYKDIFSYNREVTDEEKDIIDDLLEHSYQSFLSKIRDNRIETLNKKKWDDYTNGSIFTSKKALEYGLIDGIDFQDNAMTDLISTLGVGDDYSIFKYQSEPGFAEIFQDYFGGFNYKSEINKIINSYTNNHPKLLYLYR